MIKQSNYTLTEKELAELIEDALYKFCLPVCPYCERSLPLEDYMYEDDVREWLRERLPSGKDKE